MPFRPLFLVFGALWALFAVMPAAAQPAEGANPQRGFMWEARKGNRSIVLFGTLHVGRPDFYPLPGEKMKALERAAIIAVEADVSQAHKVGPMMQQLAMYSPAEPGLDTRIDPALKQRIESLLARAGIAPEQAWRMKPWMLANTLTVLNLAQMGYNPAFASEAFLYSLAAGGGKPLVEVEGLELQLKLFNDAPLATQMDFLRQAVAGIESGETEREGRSIVSVWESGDIAGAERVLKQVSKSGTPAERFVKEQMFEGRHPRMVAEIEKLAASGKPAVVAVGALHFFGPQGILEMLKRRGWTITQIE